MKAIALIAMCLVFLTSCAQSSVSISLPDPFTPSEACNQQLDKITADQMGESLIRAQVPNPCDAYRTLATLARVGIVWDLYKAGALAEWTDRVAEKVAAGMTYADLQTLLAKEITRFNLKLGGTYLIVSDLLVTFNEASLISGKDQAIINAGLVKLRDDARRLAMLATKWESRA